MKIEVGEEITEEEYKKLPLGEGIIVNNFYGDLTRFFKKAQQFPICFDLCLSHKVDVLEDGEMEFKIDNRTAFVVLPEEIPILIKAVEKAKEVAKKNEN